MSNLDTYIAENGIFSGTSGFSETIITHHKKVVVSTDNPYDLYPEKQAVEKSKSGKFDNIIECPLGEEYRLQPQIENYKHSNEQDDFARAALHEEINNLVVKWDFP